MECKDSKKFSYTQINIKKITKNARGLAYMRKKKRNFVADYENETYTTMLAYQNIAHGQPTQVVDRNNEYTSQVLLRLGFRWTEPDNEYIGRMLTAISQLGFFDV